MATSLLRRPAHRIRQFFASLSPRLDGDQKAEVRRQLGERLLTLFESMSLRDQQHCYGVYHRLREQGCRDADLLTAALLHDAGKGRMAGDAVRLWHRVAYVVLSTASPPVLRWLTRTGRGGLATLRHHPEAGARLAESLGAAPRVVETILRHEDPVPADDPLNLLQSADESP